MWYKLIGSGAHHEMHRCADPRPRPRMNGIPRNCRVLPLLNFGLLAPIPITQPCYSWVNAIDLPPRPPRPCWLLMHHHGQADAPSHHAASAVCRSPVLHQHGKQRI